MTKRYAVKRGAGGKALQYWEGPAADLPTGAGWVHYIKPPVLDAKPEPEPDDLALEKEIARRRLRDEARRRITADLRHGALGSRGTHVYAFDEQAQINMTAAVVRARAGTGELILCTDPSGDRDLRWHGPEKVLAVWQAWEDRKQDVRTAYHKARKALEAAETHAEAQAAVEQADWPAV